MNSREMANPNCTKCKGEGIIKSSKLSEDRICTCAILNQRQAAAQIILANALPKRALEMTFKNYDSGDIVQNERALKVARNFYENWSQARQEGWIIGFYGEPRSGKTHLAIATLQAVTKRYVIKPQFLNLPVALKQERARFKDNSIVSPFDKAKKTDLLVLDDLGAEYERQADQQGHVSWLSEQLYDLLESRFMAELPTIYTTNLSPSDMEKKYSNEAWKRVFARLDDAQVAAMEVLKNNQVNQAKAAAAKEVLFG